MDAPEIAAIATSVTSLVGAAIAVVRTRARARAAVQVAEQETQQSLAPVVAQAFDALRSELEQQRAADQQRLDECETAREASDARHEERHRACEERVTQQDGQIGVLREAVEGALEVISEMRGDDTTERILLPLDRVRSLAPRAPSHGVRRVLLVEDEAQVRRALSRALEEIGFECAAVPGAVEALAELGSQAHYDVVVTDVMMPGRDGLALYRSIRRARPGLPVVLVTGAPEDVEGWAREAGVVVVAKPASAETLRAALARALEG